MKVSAVSFASAKVSTSAVNSLNEGLGVNPLKVTKPKRNHVKFNKVSDILPVTVGLGAGLMVAYGIKSGKLKEAKNLVKNFMRIA